MIRQLVNCDYLSIMREKHLVMNRGWDRRHGISVAMPKNNVIIQRGIDDFNINANRLAYKSNRTITEEANGLGGMAIPCMKGDGGRGQLKRSELFPN